VAFIFEGEALLLILPFRYLLTIKLIKLYITKGTKKHQKFDAAGRRSWP